MTDLSVTDGPHKGQYDEALLTHVITQAKGKPAQLHIPSYIGRESGGGYRDDVHELQPDGTWSHTGHWQHGAWTAR